MIVVTILVLCAVSALGNPIEHREPISSNVEESFVGLINANRDVAVSVTKGLRKVSKELSQALKNIVQNLFLLDVPELVKAEGIKIFIDACNKFFSEIPIVGSVIEIGGKAVETEAKMWSTIGLNLLKIIKDITELNVEVLNSLVLTYLEAFEETSKNSALIIQNFLKDEAENLNEGYHKTYSIIEAAHDALINQKDIDYHKDIESYKDIESQKDTESQKDNESHQDIEYQKDIEYNKEIEYHKDIEYHNDNNHHN